MNLIKITFCCIALLTCQTGFAAQPALQNALPQPYAAPEIAGITEWQNSPALTMAQLKGKVVLVDFWTYSCINCIRTLPHVTEWYEKYKDKGFVVIGVHAPEFDFEGKPRNVADALTKYKITYPVALDNDFTTWKNYKNRFWPAHYLISQQGQIVYRHFGEGNYDITENNIRALLGLKPLALDKKTVPISAMQTPETYVGSARAERQVTDANTALPMHHWRITPNWRVTKEYIEADDKGAQLSLRFHAKKVFIVMETADGKMQKLTVTLNNEQKEPITVSASHLYQAITLEQTADGLLTLTAQKAGLRIFAFTFES